MSNNLLHVSGLTKRYHDGENMITILDNIELSIEKGEQIAIIGPSGSGKSTLLHLLGGLEKPSAGKILMHGENIWTGSEKSRAARRNQQLGFIYQFHHLLPEFTALENIAMPLLIAKQSKKEAKKIAAGLLQYVGLTARMHHKPAQLSGGERQRVAIARALVTRPACILADEPTGNLDQKTAETIVQLMQTLNRTFQTCLIVVTHDEKLASRMDRVLCIDEGRLVPHGNTAVRQ